MATKQLKKNLGSAIKAGAAELKTIEKVLGKMECAKNGAALEVEVDRLQRAITRMTEAVGKIGTNSRTFNLELQQQLAAKPVAAAKPKAVAKIEKKVEKAQKKVVKAQKKVEKAQTKATKAVAAFSAKGNFPFPSATNTSA